MDKLSTLKLDPDEIYNFVDDDCYIRIIYFPKFMFKVLRF